MEKTRINSQIVKDRYDLTTKKGSLTLADLMTRLPPLEDAGGDA